VRFFLHLSEYFRIFTSMKEQVTDISKVYQVRV